MKSRIRSAAAVTGRVLLCAAALYCAALLALRVMGFGFVAVESNSMAPTTSRGDLLLYVKRVPHVGDFILFQHHGSNVVHRLVRQTATGEWITRGDANSTDDPWQVKSREIHGIIIGVIRGFGFPVLWRESAGARFTRSATASSKAWSTYWQQAAMTWTIYQNASSITTKSPNMVTFTSSTNRKIWNSALISGPVHAHFYGKLSATDFAQGGFSMVINACTSNSDTSNCGLALSVNTNLKQIQLRTVSGDIFGKVLASAAFSVNFSTNQHLALYRSGNVVDVALNGESVIHVSNLSSLLQANNATNPTGSGCYFWINNSNRMTDARINFW
jgi:signal peptidase I